MTDARSRASSLIAWSVNRRLGHEVGVLPDGRIVAIGWIPDRRARTARTRPRSPPPPRRRSARADPNIHQHAPRLRGPCKRPRPPTRCPRGQRAFANSQGVETGRSPSAPLSAPSTGLVTVGYAVGGTAALAPDLNQSLSAVLQITHASTAALSAAIGGVTIPPSGTSDSSTR